MVPLSGEGTPIKVLERVFDPLRILRLNRGADWVLGRIVGGQGDNLCNAGWGPSPPGRGIRGPLVSSHHTLAVVIWPGWD